MLRRRRGHGPRDRCGPGGEPPRPPARREDAVRRRLERGGCDGYLYRRGFDVYDINTILSAGALGQASDRSLVPTRWSITAVDDTVGQYVRGTLRTRHHRQAGVVVQRVHGKPLRVMLAPGRWEFELVEMKAPRSVWNPRPEDRLLHVQRSRGLRGTDRLRRGDCGSVLRVTTRCPRTPAGADKQAKG